MDETDEAKPAAQLPHSKVNFKETPFAKALPIALISVFAAGFGRLYKTVGEVTGWGTYTIATFVVGPLLAGLIGGLLGLLSQLVINFLEDKVKD